MIRRNYTLCPGTKGIEDVLKNYGFKGPEDSVFGDMYEGSFAKFGDCFNIVLYLNDVPERGEYFKRFMIDCWSISENEKKERKMISKLLAETEIKNRIVTGKKITPSL